MVTPDSDRFLVSSVAYAVTRAFPMVEISDVREDLWAWYAEHPGISQRCREVAGEDDRQYERLMRYHLRNRALRFCHERRAEHVGYRMEDLAFYSKPLLRELIGPALMGGVFTVGPEPGGRSSSRPSEGGNLQVTLIDVRRAWESLPPKLAVVVSMMVARGFDTLVTAADTGLEADDVDRLFDMGLTQMQRFLGGPAPGPDEPDPEEEAEPDTSGLVALVRQGGVEHGLSEG